ncbi:MAG: hypothetical protein C0424_09485 [Sphingobacteriaceae bacterium]|nr:hypothetical protein [Sphingobacteriaceae bacterium]
MYRISVKELIDFRRKTARTKKSMANSFKKRVAPVKNPEVKGSGGDYWISCTSTIYDVIKQDDISQYDVKIEILKRKTEENQNERTKVMYQRNANILEKFKTFNLRKLKPSGKIEQLGLLKEMKIITINGVPIYVNPTLVFQFEEDDQLLIGAIWLIPQINGLNRDELTLCCETLYAFLKTHYSHTHLISELFCVVIDAFNAQHISYKKIRTNNYNLVLQETIDEIVSL